MVPFLLNPLIGGNGGLIYGSILLAEFCRIDFKFFCRLKINFGLQITHLNYKIKIFFKYFIKNNVIFIIVNHSERKII